MSIINQKIKPEIRAHIDTPSCIGTRIEIHTKFQRPLAEETRMCNVAFASVFANQIDARGIVLTRVSQTVVDVGLAAVAFETGWTFTPRKTEYKIR